MEAHAAYKAPRIRPVRLRDLAVPIERVGELELGVVRLGLGANPAIPVVRVSQERNILRVLDRQQAMRSIVAVLGDAPERVRDLPQPPAGVILVPDGPPKQ